jgi:pimeloyl-ACP methyl ester carboxylesterase
VRAYHASYRRGRQGLRGLEPAPDAAQHRVPDGRACRQHSAISVDQAIIGRPELQANLVASFREAYRRGGRAAAQEFHVLAQPWGFRLEEVAVPVRLWHGDADTVVPVGMAHVQARALPCSRLEIRPGAGHYWFFDQIEMLLRTLCFPAADAD